MSNPKWFKYALVWKKTRPSGYVQAKNKPLKTHEDIVVFSPATAVHASQTENRMTYNPQGLIYGPQRSYRPGRSKKSNASFGCRPSSVDEWVQEFTNYPRSVLDFPNPNKDSNHETQKPVALYEYLVLTYTNEGNTVLDIAMGSGTTGVACMQTGRRFIGCEIDPGYFAIAEKRIADAAAQLRLPLDTQEAMP